MKEASRNSHISGNPCPHEYLGYLTNNESKPIQEVLNHTSKKELKLRGIPNVEVARHKAKATERKLEGIKTRGDSHYRQEKETQCRYCENNWSFGHQCHKTQSYAYEIENRSKTSNSYSDNKRNKV